MKALVALLVGSVAANAVLLGLFFAKPALMPPQIRAPVASAEQRAKTNSRASADEAKLWASLRNDDEKILLQQLRDAGFPPHIIRAVVLAQIDRRYAQRLRDLAGGAVPYWKPQPRFDSSEMQRRDQLMRERLKAVTDLMGDEGQSASDLSEAQRARFGSLSKPKADLVQRIVDDYAEMTGSVRAATRGILLPEDRDKLALLETERQKDLAAVLTPQELADVEIRLSNTTARLREPMTLMNASEQEFRTIYELTRKYDSLINPPAGIMSGDAMRARQETQRQLQADIAAALGPTRAADYERASNYEFRRLASAAQSGQFTMDAAVQAYELRGTTAQESMRIAEDRSLNGAQKRAALVTLAQNTRAQLTAALGPSAGEAYARSASWLQAIEKGTAVSFNGTTTMFRTVSDPVPMPPPN